MLREQFSADMSAVYLNKMIEHLETFYEDVVSELVDKKRKSESDIEGTSSAPIQCLHVFFI